MLREMSRACETKCEVMHFCQSPEPTKTIRTEERRLGISDRAPRNHLGNYQSIGFRKVGNLPACKILLKFQDGRPPLDLTLP